MNARKTSKVFLFSSLILSFFLVGFYTPLSHALINVDFVTPSMAIPSDKPLTLLTTCEQWDYIHPSYPCSDDVIWEWTIFPPFNQPDAKFDFDETNPPNPVFTPYTKGEYNITVKVCADLDCGNDSLRLRVFDSNYECPISSKLPFVVYDSPAFPGDVECEFDSDGNGLNDLVEKEIAQCFVPEFLFDAGEVWWSLGPDEPRVVFNIALNAVNEDENIFKLVIRYGIIWAWDAGFVNSSEPWCHFDQIHPGDTQSMTVTALLRKTTGKAQWVAEFESISGFSQSVVPVPYYINAFPWIAHDGTHPWVYPSAGKHHFRPYPDEYQYYIDCGSWQSECSCTENAYGNKIPSRIPTPQHVPHFPSATPVQSGPQGGPPTIDDASGRIVWANACLLLKGYDRQVPSLLRPVDLSDWTYPNCLNSLFCDFLTDSPELQIWSSTDPLIPGSVRKITDDVFRTVNGVWSTVSGPFLDDIDEDGSPFWLDPCPVSKGNIDSDKDGLCDPIDVCPNDPYNDADGDSNCDVEVPNQPPVARCVDVTVDADDNCQGSASIDNGSYDPDRDPINLEQAPSGPYPLGHNSVTLTVADNKGEADQCSATVIVVDQEEPEITCLSPEEALCGASVEFDINATDNCTEDPLITCVPSSGSIFSIGSTYVSCTVIDNSGNSSYCDFTVTIDIKEPMRVKQGIIGTLRSFISNGDNETDQRIEKAINHLQKSLDSVYWNTDSTLGDKGKKVFDEEKKVCKELMKIHDGQDELIAAVSKVIGCLVEDDRILAQTLIAEALDAGGEQKEIDKAMKEMDKAQEENVKGKYDKAIEHYKKAWDHAQKAMKKVR